MTEINVQAGSEDEHSHLTPRLFRPCRRSKMSQQDQKAFEQAVVELNAEVTQAFNRGDVTACAEGYAEDAALYVPDRPPIKGRDEIRRVLEEWAAFGLRLEPIEVLEARAIGDMGYCAGIYRFQTALPDRGAERKEGKFVTVFVRRLDGSWKAVMDCLMDK